MPNKSCLAWNTSHHPCNKAHRLACAQWYGLWWSACDDCELDVVERPPLGESRSPEWNQSGRGRRVVYGPPDSLVLTCTDLAYSRGHNMVTNSRADTWFHGNPNKLTSRHGNRQWEWIRTAYSTSARPPQQWTVDRHHQNNITSITQLLTEWTQ